MPWGGMTTPGRRTILVRTVAGALLAAVVCLSAGPAGSLAALKAGTGFFLGGEGRLVTAAHLVSGCAAVQVVPEDGAVLEAELLSADAARDFAVLRVGGVAPASAALARGLPGSDATLTAVGYPDAAKGGRLATLPLAAVTLPIPRPDDRLPLRGAVARAGMSGAPIVDVAGRVVAMLLGRGDPAAPGATELAQRLGFPVAEVAITLPAAWLPEPGPTAAPAAVTVARVWCLAG